MKRAALSRVLSFENLSPPLARTRSWLGVTRALGARSDTRLKAEMAHYLLDWVFDVFEAGYHFQPARSRVRMILWSDCA